MKVEVISAKELTPEQSLLWSCIQESNPALASPFFCPEFTLALASVRKNVFIGVLQNEAKTIGFFPFEVTGLARGKALSLCDHQGLIVPQNVKWDAKSLLRECGLKSWDFNHLIASQEPFKSFHHVSDTSPLIDLSLGYEHYIADRRSQGTEQIKKSANLMRKLEREVGPLRFVLHQQDAGMLKQILRWADERWDRTSATESKWVGEALEKMLAIQLPQFSGMLSVLYAGDIVVAAHFGIRSRTVWHYWWPAYNSQFAKYSPGIGLLLEMVRSASSCGVVAIDLGRGGQPYKQRLKNASVLLGEGSVELFCFSNLPRIVARNAKDFIRSRPVLLNCARASMRLLQKNGKLQLS